MSRSHILSIGSIRIRLLLIAVFSLLSSIAFLQKEGQFLESSQNIISPFTVTSYSTKQGLPQSRVIDIIRKQDGALILATANGIVEYDGQEFIDFIRNKSYRDHLCRELFWDDTYHQLFVTDYEGGLYQFHPDYRLVKKCTGAALHKHVLYTIDSWGNLSKSGVRKVKFNVFARTGIRNATTLFIRLPFIYIGSPDGLHVYNMKTHQLKKRLSDGITGFAPNSFNGKLYAFSARAVYEVGEKPSELFRQRENDPHALTDVAFIDSDTYYVSTSQGLYCVLPEYTDYYDKKFISSDYIGSLYYDSKEDCLFAGSGEKGLLKLQHKNCYSHSSNDELAKASLGSVIITPTGDIVVAGSSGKLFRIGLTDVSVYWQHDVNFSSLALIDSRIFAGTYGTGVFVLENQQPVYHLLPPQLPHTNAHSVFRDSQGMTWIGTGDGIACGKTLKEIHPFLTGKITGKIVTFYECSNGDLCIGGANGCYILNRNRRLIRTLSRKEGLISKEVCSFYEDREKKLWIGTYNGGLYCYHNNKLTSINRMKNCLLFSDVFTLARDSYGYFNMTSNLGLWKVSEKQLNDFYYGRLDRLIPFYFGQETGILNTEFNGGFQNNYARTTYNHFFFPTIEGVVINVPEEFTFRKLHPKIRRVWVNDTVFMGARGVFERSTHTLQFDFSSARFSEKYNAHYQYKLLGEGFPDEWSHLQKHRSISFKMLPPGEYVLMIRAVDAFNDPHPQILRHAFRIKPYFYETFWFRMLLLALLLLGIVMFVRWRVTFASRKVRHINGINNTILELKLKAIQAKMNPHFIFNALNNIQYLIVLRKLEVAENTLTDFSQLLRKFLQQSDQNFVTLEEEFEMLRLYLSIEKFRFNNQLTCHFQADEEIRNLYVPSILLQPLVENAIKHGLLHSEKERVLQISARRQANYIRVTIEDNGIGREASLELNKNRPEHISHGLLLVQEKIKIVREKYGLIVHFRFVDIYEGTHTGTQVVFDFPILEESPVDN